MIGFRSSSLGSVCLFCILYFCKWLATLCLVKPSTCISCKILEGMACSAPSCSTACTNLLWSSAVQSTFIFFLLFLPPFKDEGLGSSFFFLCPSVSDSALSALCKQEEELQGKAELTSSSAAMSTPSALEGKATSLRLVAAAAPIELSHVLSTDFEPELLHFLEFRNSLALEQFVVSWNSASG